MSFQILALDPAPFLPLFGADEATLVAAGAVPCVADAKPGFPCRVSLQDAEPGTRLLLLNHTHLDCASPYRASHAIFVAEGAEQAQPAAGSVPEMIRSRLLSIRSFDKDAMMLDADVCAGDGAAELIDRLLEDEQAVEVHIHTARRGCLLARAVRRYGSARGG